MYNALYTVVPVNMKEFMDGKNPTTQPGQFFQFFTSMQAATQYSNLYPEKHIYDEYYQESVPDENYGFCVLKFNAKDVSLMSTEWPKAVGYASIPTTGCTFALIMQPSNNGFAICSEIENGDFEAFRAQMLQKEKEDFIQNGLRWHISIGAGRDPWLSTDMSPLTAHLLMPHIYGVGPELIEKANDLYHAATGTEKEKIIAVLTGFTGSQEYAIRTFEAQKNYYENTSVSIHSGRYVTSHQASIYYAAANLACLPENLRDIATNVFNEKMWEYHQLDNLEYNTERSAATSVAYAIEYILPMVEQQYPDLLPEVLQNGKSAMQTAIECGASQSEMVVNENDRIFTTNILHNGDIGEDFGELN